MVGDPVGTALAPDSRKRLVTILKPVEPVSSKKSKLSQSNIMPKRGKKVRVGSGTSSPATALSDQDAEFLSYLQQNIDSPIEGTEFEVEVKKSLRLITSAFFGDKATKSTGLIKRVEDLEEDVYGGDDPAKGFSARLDNLEEFQKTSTASSATASAGESSTTQVAELQQEVSLLKKHNAFLAGSTAHLHAAHQSLQDEVYVQKDRQNYLNLHLGGVSEEEGKSPKEQATQFFKDVLELTHVTPSCFVKAYRKSGPKEFTDTV